MDTPNVVATIDGVDYESVDLTNDADILTAAIDTIESAGEVLVPHIVVFAVLDRLRALLAQAQKKNEREANNAIVAEKNRLAHPIYRVQTFELVKNCFTDGQPKVYYTRREAEWDAALYNLMFTTNQSAPAIVVELTKEEYDAYDDTTF